MGPAAIWVRRFETQPRSLKRAILQDDANTVVEILRMIEGGRIPAAKPFHFRDFYEE